MTTDTMTTELDARYSDPAAGPIAWRTAEQLLIDAELYWFTTLRPGGGPHVTPVIGLWHAGAGYICTGADEQKSANLAVDPHATLMTGCNTLHQGTDVIVEARSVRVLDDDRLRTVADRLRDKYGDEWSFGVDDGAFIHPEGGRATVYRLAPNVVYAFGKAPYTHTRYTPLREPG